MVTILFCNRPLAIHAFMWSFGDGADLMLVDEEIRMAVARDAHHIVVEVLDPAIDHLAIAQLHLHADLAVAERA